MGWWQKIKAFFGFKTEPTAEERVESEISAEEKHLKQFESKIAGLLSRKRNLSDELALAEHDAVKWTSIAEAAAATKKEDNVRGAARQKLEAEQKRDHLKDELATIEKTIDNLNEQLRLAGSKIDLARADQATLTARLEAARIRQDLAGEGAGPMKALSDLEDKTIENEAKAESSEEISQFQQDFLRKNVVSNNDVEIEVKRLMERKRES